MQQLAEGNVELRPPKNTETKNSTYKTGQQKLVIKKIEKQVTLLEYI